MVNMNVGWAGPNPSLAKLAGELNARFGPPKRHYEYVTGYKSPTNITSHNADAYGRGHGMDIFVGAGHNISVEQGIDLAERLRLEGKKGSIPGHPDRLAYIIHRGRICGDHTGWEWVAYNGVADHYDHIHISSVFDYYWGDVVAGNPDDYNSTAAWNLWTTALPQADNIIPIQEDEVVTPEDRLAIVRDLLDYQLNQVGGGKITLANMLAEYRPHVAETHDKLTKLPNKVVNVEFARINTEGKVGGAATISSVLGVHDANVVLTRGVITGAAEAVTKAVTANAGAAGISPEEQGKRAAEAFLAEVKGLQLSITEVGE